MGSLSNLYISQSYTSLAHLGTNNALVPGQMTILQDGLGQSLNISFDGTNISSSGNIFAANLTGSGGTINTGSLVTTSSFNSYTQSTNIRLTNIENATGSYATTGSNTFTGGNTFQTTINAQNGLSIVGQTTFGDGVILNTLSLENISGSLVFNKIATASKVDLQNLSLLVSGTFTASLQEGYVWVGNNAGKTVTVATSSFGGGTLPSGLLSSSVTNFVDYSASVDSRINGIVVGSGFATLGANTFTGSQNISNANLVISNTGSAFITMNAATQSNLLFNSPGTTLTSYGTFNFTNNGNAGGSGSLQFSATSASISYYSRDGFIFGRITPEAGPLGNGFVKMNTSSGSLVLTPSGFNNNATDLLHLSGSSNSNNVNLIFKNSNTAADTIISGSNNIFTNPAAPTAGFKRYMTGGNIAVGGNGVAIPQISGSMAFSPTIANNYFGVSANPMTIRGPISSSAYTINNNVFVGGAFNLGVSAANNFERAVNGLNVTNNLLTGTLNAIASKTQLSASIAIVSNNIAGGVNLNMDSSSINLQGNIVQGTLTVNNSYFPATTGSQVASSVQGGLFVGTHTIFLSGSNTTFTGAPGRTIANASIIGISNVISASYNSDLAQVNSAILLGQSLNVLGTNSRTAGPTAADWGSVFVGRWNDFSGNKGGTGETVFAVGTGRGTSTRKTGFLIDSGSNSYFEGTLNVSGSSTFTGSLNGLTLTRGPGNNNVGIGVNILQNAVSGGNVALGTDALRDNTSGTDNVALGNSALLSNISGDRNMAIGSNALDSNTTGTLNVAIGNATLAGLVDGSANVGIGFEALKNQITGSNNVGIGSQALNQNISGSGNIAFGAKAGYNETGNNNFYVNNTEYGSINADRSGSLMWGKMDTTTANQTLQINADTTITNDLTIQSGSGDLYMYGHKMFNLGVFTSTLSQSGSANVSQSMTFNNTEETLGVTLNGGGTQLTITNDGYYNIQFSAQILAESGADDVRIWLKKNGTNIANTTGRVTLANNEELMAAWNYVVSGNAGDYYELVWETTDGDALLLFNPSAGNYPAVPSVIVTVTQVR
jgi:hypothetical protein